MTTQQAEKTLNAQRADEAEQEAFSSCFFQRQFPNLLRNTQTKKPNNDDQMFFHRNKAEFQSAGCLCTGVSTRTCIITETRRHASVR